MDARRHVRRAFATRRALEDAARPDAVREVDVCEPGAIRFMTPWQVPTKSSSRPKSVRKVMNISAKRELIDVQQPFEVV